MTNCLVFLITTIVILAEIGTLGPLIYVHGFSLFIVCIILAAITGYIGSRFLK